MHNERTAFQTFPKKLWNLLRPRGEIPVIPLAPAVEIFSLSPAGITFRSVDIYRETGSFVHLLQHAADRANVKKCESN